MTPQQMYEIVLLAICVWREAQNQSRDAQIAVACSIKNRVDKPSWWGHDWVSVILMPEQYSSFNAKDPNAVKLPHADSLDWDEALTIASDVYEGLRDDTTSCATHYYDKSLDAAPPAWARDGSMIETAVIDALRFWRHA